jgi:hypothetical protein
MSGDNGSILQRGTLGPLVVEDLLQQALKIGCPIEPYNPSGVFQLWVPLQENDKRRRRRRKNLEWRAI